jgi:hypothetical protein
MCQEKSWLLLLHLCDVGLAASWLSTLLGLMAKLATVVAGAVSFRLLVADGAAGGASAGATLGTSLRPGLGTSAWLVLLAVLAAARRGRGLPLLPVTLAGLPLFPSPAVLKKQARCCCANCSKSSPKCCPNCSKSSPRCWEKTTPTKTKYKDLFPSLVG